MTYINTLPPKRVFTNSNEGQNRHDSSPKIEVRSCPDSDQFQ